MKMNKTIASLALFASATSAHAIVPPNLPTHKACITIYKGEKGATYAGDCDETANNKDLSKPLNKESGCAKGQASLVSYSVKVPACMPVGVVQL